MPRAELWLTALLFPLVVSASGQSGSAADLAQLADVAARAGSRDVRVPVNLVARVEKEYDDFLTGEGVANKGAIKRVLLNVRAELRQKRPGALHENTRIVTPLGGGVVDLAEVINPVRAAFSARILPTREDGSPVDNLRVYYVSRAKKRTIDGEPYGAGCDKWMEITGYFKKVMGKTGFELYTADQRYLSVLGGTFVLIGFTKEAIAVGSISFTDSRFPNVLCEEPEKNEKVH